MAPLTSPHNHSDATGNIRTLRDESPPRTMSFGTRLTVIVYGYLVVILVFLVFLALEALPYDFYGFQLGKLDSSQRLVVSVILVAPVILGLLWDRVKGFKIAEIEVVLEQASLPINIELAGRIQVSKGSATLDLVELIAAAIAQQDLRLVEVNLRSRPYWWTTRLFLLAALIQEYTDVERIIFVKYDALRVFVGIAAPASVRRILGERFPPLEVAFRSVLENLDPSGSKEQKVYNIGYTFPVQMFPRNGEFIPEEKYRQKIGARTLCEWLGPELQTETRQWSGGPPSNRLYAKILACEARFVPLLIGPRLAKVVDRGQLVERLAIAAVT